MYDISFAKIFPIEFVSSQLIKVIHNDNEYKIWVYAKRNPGENFGMNGESFNLSCELSDKLRTERMFDSILKTSCR
ncbi:DUF6795 domain-containing protein [Microbulbifer thermotolerans]|uniref:DUF6795 domain-containing protein n=1 Tax=Microbulbifer thermotolerans TaxID=252514 RepID=UPI00396A44A2